MTSRSARPKTPRRTPTQSTSTAAASDLAELTAMKERLSRAYYADDTPPRDLAALSRRMLEVGDRIKALEALEAERADDATDERADEEWTGL